MCVWGGGVDGIRVTARGQYNNFCKCIGIYFPSCFLYSLYPLFETARDSRCEQIVDWVVKYQNIMS